ncbi:polysaccharide deacetylase family protein [candidate division KSB1 bacterium]|nr:polysaccharide deacetylase family protein [candidate division KSB1 bacterium]
MEKTFCSYKCIVKAVGNSVVLWLGPKKKKTGKKKPQISLGRFFSLFLNVVLVLVMVLLWYSNRKLSQEIGALQSAVSTMERGADTTAVKPGFSLQKLPGAMVRQNNINISGEAESNTVISLKVNEIVKSVTIPENNKFFFRDVQLDYGDNDIIIQAFDKDGRILFLERLTTKFGNPTLDYLARDITHGDVTVPKIALTFDGGAGNGAAHEILDILASKNIKSTMFLTGAFLKSNPLLVKRMIDDGHEIANHTWSHPHLTTYERDQHQNTIRGITRESVQNELKSTEEFFQNMTKRKMAPYWRAPFGEHNQEIRSWAAEIGYQQVGWTYGKGETLDTMDWIADTTHASYKSPQQVLKKIINFGSENGNGLKGGIILMHLDTQRKTDPVHKIIPALVDSMRAAGYQFVTVSQLLNE